jgi:hypothetical protein
VRDRGSSGVPGERAREREKNDGEIQMWESREMENRSWTEEEERRCRMCHEERQTIEHMWSGCNEMRERERKERKEILNEDGRKLRWMKDIWKRRERIVILKGGR